MADTSPTDRLRPGFVHLHLHSEYSLLDGGNRIPELVERVQSLGMDAVALTDHGNLFGAVELYRRCKEAGVRPILGIEAYVAPDVKNDTSDRTDKTPQGIQGVADGGFHLVLLAMNQIGWRNLVKLSSDSFLEGFYYKPRMDKGTLARWSDGLIAINGHLGSSLAYHLLAYDRTGSDEHWERARREARWHAEVFGPDEHGEPRFYLELQRHGTPEQDRVNVHVLRLAEELGLPLVCDNDAHFLTADRWDSHDTLVCVSTGKLKAEEQRLRYPEELYVKGPEAMAELFSDVPEALENTVRIAERCDVELDFSANHAPLVGIRRREPSASVGRADAPEGSTEWFQRLCSTYELVPIDSSGELEKSREELEAECDRALRELTEAGLVWRYRDGVTEEHRARLERELQILSDKDISAYFLICWDFVNEARNRGIPAQARGSGVGTMVGYLLGLSNACPVRYGLLFERFTDPNRSEYPDIDIDLCQDGRGEILDYVHDKYGFVAQIITYGRMKARAAVRDVGRVLDLPLPEVDKICKLIGDQLGVTIQDALAKEPDLKRLYESEPPVREVLDTALDLEGMVRHSGVHAAGVVIATEPLENLVPLAISKQGSKEITVTQWDGPTVEQMGLLKMDFLGLKTLSILTRAQELVRETLADGVIRDSVGQPDPKIDPLDLDRIDFSDQEVLDLYRRGETVGTFQFESDGMRDLLLKMKPDRLEDLVAGNALYRPGPMALIPNYCDRKHGQEAVPEVHEIVDRFTADTYGIMVYQEQVMQIVHELGGIPLRDAYSLIKAISKKKEDVIAREKSRFLAGAEEKGLDRRTAAELFGMIQKFAGYGFNKSHSVGYSILAFQTAFLKTYFPIQYMAAVLTYEADNTDKLSVYLAECERVRLPDGSRGVEVKPPDINLSGVRFHVVFDDGEEHRPERGHIRFGLSAVKGVGTKAVEAILEVRREDGPFRGLYDVCERVPLGLVNRTALEALIKAGAFDSLHGPDSRASLVEALETAMRHGQRIAADRESGQASLFGMTAAASPTSEPAPLPETPPWTVQERLQHEKAALGFFASCHPLDEHRELLERFSTAPVPRLQEMAAGTEVTLGAMVASLRVVRTKRGRNPGQKMGFLQLDDGQGRIEAVIFSDVWETVEKRLTEDAVLFFTGTVEHRREEPSLVVSSVFPVDSAVARLTREVRIQLRERDLLSVLADRRPLEAHLQDLHDFLDTESQRANGSSADVVFQVELDDQVVHIAAEGLRVPVDPELPERVARLLGTPACCALWGQAPPPRLADPGRRGGGFRGAAGR